MNYIIKQNTVSLFLLLIVGLIIPSAFAESVPSWVKNTAGWWATDAISETEFVNAIEFLVKEDIIQVDASQTSETSQGVPSWVKNTAGWWATDAISETEFVNAIAYLIKVGIITLEEKLIQSDTDLRVAFIGDQGNAIQSIAVLNLIKDEGAHIVLHQGDFDYDDNPEVWDKMISDVLGNDFPYLASIGHHDELAWSDYQQKLYDRLKKNPDVECSGDLGVKSSCTYHGLFFILVGPGTFDPAITGSGHDSFIKNQLSDNEHMWRVCSWSENMHYMQLGVKPDKVGWEVYENCKNGGAIIATAHEHSYHRTKTLINIENQILDPRWPEPDKLRVKEGSTFVFVSGLGGHSIRDQDRCLPVSYPYGCNEEWAKIYTSDQDADFGALFCTFNVDGQSNKASCYFKNIRGEVVDKFTITNLIGIEDAEPNLHNIDLSTKDLSNRDLSGMVLVDIDLTDVNLTGTKLMGANLSLSNLAGADLSNKDLTGTILRATGLTKADFTGTILTDTNLSNSILTNVDLSGKDLTGNNFSNAFIADVDLSNAILVGSNLSDAVLIRTTLTGADLTDANLTGADLSDMDLTGTKLRGVDLKNVDIDGVNLSGMDLTDARLRGMDLTDKDLTGTILVGADLTNAVLPSSYLSGNNFTGTIFDRVNFAGEDLSKSDFSFASFRNADMTNITAKDTEFVGVDFTKIKNTSLMGSNLSNTSFAYSNLSGVNLNDSNLLSLNLQHADLTDQDFTNSVNLTEIDFYFAKLSNANFEGVDLAGRDASVLLENKADLINSLSLSEQEDVTKLRVNIFGERNTIRLLSMFSTGNDLNVHFKFVNNFAKTDLTNANFKNADLNYAILYGANLTNANFTGADLSNTDLVGANLEGANLEGANLEGAHLKCINHSICIPN